MVATVGSIRALFEADMRGYTASLQKGERATGRFAGRVGAHVKTTQASILGLNTTASQLAGTLMRTLGPALGGLGLLSISRNIRTVVSDLSQLGKVAAKVGVDAEQLQRLQFGFELSGVAANTTNMALQRFSRRVAEAANGSGELLPILEANNVALRDADGRMRSQIDVLRDYANLIRGASSSQERLLLAFKAFDSEGAAFVVGLQNGASGLDTLMSKADEAGGVIENELVKKAEELDDEFAIVWRNFELNAKRAIINTVTALRPLDKAARDLLANLPVARLSELVRGDSTAVAATAAELGNLRRELEILEERRELNIELEMPTDEVEGRIAAVKDQIVQLQRQLASLNDEAARSYTVGTPGDPNALARAASLAAGRAVSTPKPTIIPQKDDGSGKGSRDAAARAALREAEAVATLIDNLAHELSLVGASDVEKAKANAVRQAGSAATADQVRQIQSLVQAIHSENAALEANEEAQRNRTQALENLFGMGEDALLGIVDVSMEAEEALKRLVIQLALAAAQAALLGSGPLAGIFGGGFGLGGGVSSAAAIAGGAVGLFHEGGDVDSPKAFRTLPRFHTGRSGVGHDELMAVLEKSESVLTADQTGNVVDTMGAMASRIQDGGRDGGDIRVWVDDDGNLRAVMERVADRRAGSALREYDKGSVHRTASNIEEGRRRRIID